MMFPIENRGDVCNHGNNKRECNLCKKESTLKMAQRRVESFYTDYGVLEKEHVGVDSEIKQLVALFIAMGLETEQSCWGHPDRIGNKSQELNSGELNFLPYISFTGYSHDDGIDSDDHAIGYTADQVRDACLKMEKDADKLKKILELFYCDRHDTKNWIVLYYPKGMPGAKLDTHMRLDYNEKPERLSAEIITEVQNQWNDFITFVEEYYKKNDV